MTKEWQAKMHPPSSVTSSLPAPVYASPGQICGPMLSGIGLILIALGAILRYYPGIGTTPMWIQIGCGLGSFFIGMCVYGVCREDSISTSDTAPSTEKVALTRLSRATTSLDNAEVIRILKELETSRTRISAYKAAWKQALQQYGASPVRNPKQIAILEAILTYLKAENLPALPAAFLVKQLQHAQDLAELLLRYHAPERVLTPLLTILSKEDRYEPTVKKLLAAGADPSKMSQPSSRNALLRQASLRQPLKLDSLPMQRAAFERVIGKYREGDANALGEMRTLLTQAKAAVLPDTPVADVFRYDKAKANEMALLLIAHNAPEPQLTPFLFLLVEDDTYVSTVERLLLAQADPDECDPNGKRALHLAFNAPLVTVAILSHSKDAVNRHDSLGYYPLHYAVRAQNAAVVTSLFQAGAKNLRHNNPTPFQELVRPILTADHTVSALTPSQSALLRAFKPHVEFVREIDGLMTSINHQYTQRLQRGNSTGDAVNNHTNAHANCDWLLSQIRELN